MNQDIFIILIWASISTIGFFYYLRDMFAGKTKPHMFTWFIWALMSYIGFGIQVTHGAGLASLIILWFAIIPTIVFFYTLKDSQKDIAPADYLSLLWAIVALIFWIIFDKAIISVILLLIIDYCAYFPTFRKSWNKPYEETILLFVLVNAWYLASIITFDNFTFVNYGYPLGLIIINTVFVSYILIRRKVLKK